MVGNALENCFSLEIRTHVLATVGVSEMTGKIILRKLLKFEKLKGHSGQSERNLK